MMGHNISFYGKIWKIIPKLSLFPRLIWITGIFVRGDRETERMGQILFNQPQQLAMTKFHFVHVIVMKMYFFSYKTDFFSSSLNSPKDLDPSYLPKQSQKSRSIL